jgi:hypothetical protein
MADFIPYQHPTPRVRSGSIVRLSAERWAVLKEHFNASIYVVVPAPVMLGEILFLPALYRAA